MAFQLWQGQYRTWSPQHTCLCLLHLNKMILIVMEETIFCCYLMFHSRDSLSFHWLLGNICQEFQQKHSNLWTGMACCSQPCIYFSDWFWSQRSALNKDSLRLDMNFIKILWVYNFIKIFWVYNFIKIFWVYDFLKIVWGYNYINILWVYNFIKIFWVSFFLQIYRPASRNMVRLCGSESHNHLPSWFNYLKKSSFLNMCTSVLLASPCVV